MAWCCVSGQILSIGHYTGMSMLNTVLGPGLADRDGFHNETFLHWLEAFVLARENSLSTMLADITNLAVQTA